jgi:hypothetical protein
MPTDALYLLVRAVGDSRLHLTGGAGRTVCGLVLDRRAGVVRDGSSAPGCPVCGVVVLPAGLELRVPGR